MENDTEWIDAGVPPDQAFSVRRTSRLFISIMLASIIGGVPIALYEFGVLRWKQHQAEQAEQEKLREGFNELQEAAKEGKTGPAFQRLFGVENKPAQSN